MNAKKVLLIATNDINKSGVPAMMMQIVRLLSKDFSFDVLVTRDGNYYKNEFMSYGGKVISYKERQCKNKISRIIYLLFFQKLFVSKYLKQLYKNNHYDIVHSFKDTEGWLYLKGAKKAKISIRINECSRIIDYPKNFFKKCYVKRSIYLTKKYSTKLVSVSEKAAINSYGLDNTTVIPNTYDEVYYHFIENKGDTLSLLQIGTFLPIKNQLFTLTVLKQLVKDFPDMKMVFVGRIFDKDYYKSFISYINMNDLTKNVEIVDSNIDQIELYEKCSFVLVPSTQEGFSLVAIESQACGVTCIASNILPKETNLGNIIYLDLKSQKWAETIKNLYLKDGNNRKKVNMSKVSNAVFKENYYNLYN